MKSSFEVMHFLSSTRLFVSREKSPLWNSYSTFTKLSQIHLFIFLEGIVYLPAKMTPDLEDDEKSHVCDRVNKLWAVSCDRMRSKRVKRSPVDGSLINRALQQMCKQTNKRSKPMLLSTWAKKLASHQLKPGSRYLPSTHHIFPLPPPPLRNSLYNV